MGLVVLYWDCAQVANDIPAGRPLGPAALASYLSAPNHYPMRRSMTPTIRTTAILALATSLAACAGTTSEMSLTQAVRQAEATITAEDLQHRIAYLASDELRGRDTPSPGLEAAAAWIADEFQRFGLEPAGEDGFMQRYPFPLEALNRREARLDVSGGATHTLEYGTDFFAYPGEAPTHSVGVVYMASPQELERVPAGALRGRAALIRLVGSPEPARGGVRLDARAREQVREAAARAGHAGAAALVFVLGDQVGRSGFSALASTAEAPGRVAGGRATAGEPATFFMSHAAAVRMFRMARLSGAELLRVNELDRPLPLPGITLRLAAPYQRLDEADAPNVVGLLPGSDSILRETFVVLSAHMDHVGVGRPDATGDSIYSGADDNASGTAALMAIARAFALLPDRPERSIVFLAVSGEEKGLVGSRWFAEHPTVPRDGMVANINLDMIGRNAPDSIVVIGKEYSSLGPLVREVAQANRHLGLTVAPDLWPEERFFFRSDHFSFAAREIPALFFFAGTHEDYHRPSDTADRIDADKVERVARLAFLLTNEIARLPEAPVWDPDGLEAVRAMTRR
jgi:hypothetical protein